MSKVRIDAGGRFTRFEDMGSERWLVGMLLLIGGCERQPPARANDTALAAPPPPAPAPVVRPVAEPSWDTAAGPVFLVMGATSDQAAVVVPAVDSSAALDAASLPTSSYRGRTFDTFTSGQRVGAVTIADPLQLELVEDCSAWPAVRLTGVRDSVAWNVAFAAGRFATLGIDSLAALSRGDSARLTREIARVASAVPNDTAEALRGLPFGVRRAWLLTSSTAATFVLAEVGRTLNQEASPIQEHLLILAERDTSRARTLRLSYFERSIGGEESIESTELLAAGILKGRQEPVILIARYLGDGVVYSLLARQPNGTWRLRWSSPYAGC